MLKNKRGWVKILEAFFAVLLLGGIILAFLGSQNISSSKNGPKIYKVENSILRNIEINNSLRNEILGFDLSSSSPMSVSGILPVYLNCSATICTIGENCNTDTGSINKNVYTQSVFIASNLTLYSPRKIALSCWEI